MVGGACIQVSTLRATLSPSKAVSSLCALLTMPECLGKI